MDHKAFLASVAPETRIALTERSDKAGLIHLAGHAGLILFCGLYIGFGLPLWGALLPVQGVLIVFLFTLEHECTHQTPFANRRLNEAVGYVCGVLLLLPFRWFRAFHLAHHRWTNLPGQDPELDGPKPETLRDWVIHVSGLPYWRSEAGLLWALARGKGAARYISASALPAIRTEARVLLALYALAALSLVFTPLLLWIWIIPVLVGQPFLRLYLLAEHGDCPAVADMFLNTRTTFTTGMVRFLAWNMPYHTEHHVWPAVPFYRLPALHQRMKDHLGVTADGYTDFTAEYLSRRRDPKQGPNP